MKLLVCGRSDLGEEYLCELIDPGQHAHAGPVDPIVRVLAVLKYPRQRAISMPEVVSEVSPVMGGTVCRLPVIRETDDHQTPPEWEASAADAQRDYLERCQNAAEREIILRHMAGEYRPRRSLRTYKQYELDAARKAWAEVENGR